LVFLGKKAIKEEQFQESEGGAEIFGVYHCYRLWSVVPTFQNGSLYFLRE
jgi:hypothetical protein